MQSISMSKRPGHSGTQMKIRAGGSPLFSVQFEVHPKDEQFDAYPGYAKLLKPQLEEIVTEAGDGNTVILIDAPRTEEVARDAAPLQLATWLGLEPDSSGLTFWDVYDAVLTPGVAGPGPVGRALEQVDGLLSAAEPVAGDGR
jgi:hypothetical protein